MSQRTPLYEAHLAVGAKIVDFGGWDMPLSYGSQIEEHHAVRKRAGMFDVSHMLNVDLQGPDAQAFLRRLLANDVARIVGSPGRAMYSCMLHPDGGVVDDLIVYFLGSDTWRVVVNAGTADKDVAWMREVMETGGFDLKLTPRRDLAMLAIQGPEARDTVWAVRPDWRPASAELQPFTATRIDENVLIARTGYTGEDGFEVVLPADRVRALWDDLLAAGVHPCGLGARDTLRLEAGMHLYGQDVDESVHPLESGLSWTVSFKDGQRDFVGRAALEAADPRRTIVGLKLLERGVMRSHMKVRTPDGEGEVTSGTMSPTMGVSIGLARVPAATAPGTRVEVEIRGKWTPAEVTKLPFVRHGQILA